MEEVVIMYNMEDSGTWPVYLQDQIVKDESVSAKTFLAYDKSVFDTMDTRSENRILKAKVMLIIVTPAHVEYLQSNNRATYERLVCTGEKGIMLLLGIEVEELQSSMLYGKFPEFEKWTKIVYQDDNSIKELLYKMVEIIERPESLRCGFSVIPTTLICEEETQISIMIDEPIPVESKVEAVIKNNNGLMDRNIPATRVNPHCYTITMPESEECEATIYVDVNGHSLGSQAKVIYRSYLRTEDAVAVSELYCHCLDVLVKVIIKQQTVDDMDQKLSEIFDHITDLPIKGFENLFGIYQYFVAEASRAEFPSLIHLAAKYNLQETLSRLQDQKQFIKACSVTNKEGLRPLEIAERRGNIDFANFIREVEEQMDIYASMCTSYVSGTSTKEAYYNVKNEQRIPDVQEDYLDMEFGSKKGRKGSKKKPSPAAFPEDPSENYLPMGGTTGTGEEDGGNDSDQSGYEGVQDWRDVKDEPSAEEEEQFTISGSAQDLINLQQGFKDGKVSLDQVESLFKQWQQDRSGSAKSFQEKQAMMKETRKQLDKVKLGSKSASRGPGKKNEKKKEKKMAEEEKKAPIYKTVQKSSSFRQAAPQPSSKSYKEESLYASREPVAPPVPGRRFMQSNDTPPARPMRQKVQTPMQETEPVDYLEFEGDEADEDYTYVEKDDICVLPPEPSRHNYPIPNIPSGPEENYIDTDRRSQRGSNRFSNASTSSRTSSMSTGSGRDSTVSSGIDDDSDVQAELNEDYDLQSEKRRSIEMMNLPAPPPIPNRGGGRGFQHTPPSPDTPQETETSIPLEAPPPIPGHAHLMQQQQQQLEAVEEEPQEEISPEEEFRNKIQRVTRGGATDSPQAAMASLFGKGIPLKPQARSGPPKPPPKVPAKPSARSPRN